MTKKIKYHNSSLAIMPGLLFPFSLFLLSSLLSLLHLLFLSLSLPSLLTADRPGLWIVGR
jgi:hypothetical protein